LLHAGLISARFFAVITGVILSHLLANAETARRVIADVIPRIPNEPNWPEHSALDTALVTDRKLWPEATTEKLRPILARFVAE
jgi:5'-methylthioadenosine phosphorylase